MCEPVADLDRSAKAEEADGTIMQQHDWKANVDAIRSLLLAEWDPIGCGVPKDEYDSYIPSIYHLIERRVSIEELAVHLQEIEDQQMCLPARLEVNCRVAKMLLELMQ